MAVFTAALDLALPFTDNYSTKRPIFNYFDVQVHTSHSHVGVLAVAVWLVATRSLLIYQQPQDPEAKQLVGVQLLSARKYSETVISNAFDSYCIISVHICLMAR